MDLEQRVKPLTNYAYDEERANIPAVLLVFTLVILGMATAIVGFIEICRRLGWL